MKSERQCPKKKRKNRLSAVVEDAVGETREGNTMLSTDMTKWETWLLSSLTMSVRNPSTVTVVWLLGVGFFPLYLTGLKDA